MKNKIYCNTCNHRQRFDYGSTGYCKHFSAIKIIDNFWEQEITYKHCSDKNKENDCSFYEKELIEESILKKFFKKYFIG